MVEGVHFRIEWADPELIGRKALAVTLSDVAAMGGSAKFAMVSIALPPHLSAQFIEKTLGGLFDLAHSCGVSIIGGDTSSSRDSLFIDTIAIGECAAGRAVTRRGAEAGNRVYVTGTLGASATGLMLLERGMKLREANAAEGEIGRQYREALVKHLAPEPRLIAGRLIGERELATAMIDISDGLSTDLTHILEESDCGAIIRAEAMPVAESALDLSIELEIDPLSLALHGGEEYELLFTARPETHSRIEGLSSELGLPITAIGEITSARGLQLERDGKLRPLMPAGYEHKI
jgi:thiamine-monophosphate kinase